MKLRQSTLICILSLTGTLAVMGQVYASGLQITEQSVTGLGRAFAGGSLVNDDLSAAHFNPADMMLVQGTQAQVGFTFLGIDMQADNAGSSQRLPANLQQVITQPGTLPVFVTLPGSGLAHDDGGSENVVPNGYYVMEINERMRFGLAMVAPFAVSTHYNRDWIGRYHAVDSELVTIDINPSVAYRMSPQLSVGFGVSAQYVDATLSQAIFTGGSDGYGEVNADGWAAGYNLGATYELDAHTRFGVSYRSRINHSVTGDRTLSDVPNKNGQVGAQAQVTLPDWAGIAAYRRLNEQWAIMGSVRWTHWSLFRELKIEFDDGTENLTEENWEDNWSFSLGATYDYHPEWTFRTGYVYDQTPVPSAELRTPRIPDANRHALGLGFSYHPREPLSVDFGYMYINFDDARTENTISLAPSSPGLITDTLRVNYTGSGHLVGVQASYRF